MDTEGVRVHLLEGEHLEAVYDGSEQILAKYLRGVVVDEIVNGYYYDEYGKKTNYTFHHDHLSSVAALTAHEGSTVETTKYGPFGEEIASTGSSENFLKYTGREHDAEIGLYYYRARYYDPEVGGFLNEDPLGFEAGVNFYTYVQNNPINANDPMGLATKVAIGYTNTPVPGTAHQFVLLTDTITGEQFATRAGPESQSFMGSASNSSLSASGGSVSATVGYGGSGGFGFGQIEAITGPYLQTFRDAPNVHTWQEIGVIERDFTNSVANAINFSNVTNENKIPYGFLNSNSYASTFVESLTGTRPDPMLTAPGWSLGSPSPKLSYKASTFMNAGSASGGFVLYPNKPNTNMMQQVYAK